MERDILEIMMDEAIKMFTWFFVNPSSYLQERFGIGVIPSSFLVVLAAVMVLSAISRLYRYSVARSVRKLSPVQPLWIFILFIFTSVVVYTVSLMIRGYPLPELGSLHGDGIESITSGIASGTKAIVRSINPNINFQASLDEQVPRIPIYYEFRPTGTVTVTIAHFRNQYPEEPGKEFLTSEVIPAGADKDFEERGLALRSIGNQVSDNKIGYRELFVNAAIAYTDLAKWLNANYPELEITRNHDQLIHEITVLLNQHRQAANLEEIEEVQAPSAVPNPKNATEFNSQLDQLEFAWFTLKGDEAGHIDNSTLSTDEKNRILDDIQLEKAQLLAQLEILESQAGIMQKRTKVRVAEYGGENALDLAKLNTLIAEVEAEFAKPTPTPAPLIEELEEEVTQPVARWWVWPAGCLSVLMISVGVFVMIRKRRSGTRPRPSTSTTAPVQPPASSPTPGAPTTPTPPAGSSYPMPWTTSHSQPPHHGRRRRNRRP